MITFGFCARASASASSRVAGKLTLSVGIPTFNQAEFLPATLDSLLNQTHPPDEIVVSDHYSTDNTQEVLSSYKDRLPTLRIVQPPPGVNLTGQYNFTLSSLTGDWITIFNSDDIAYPRYCETLLRGAASDPNAVTAVRNDTTVASQALFLLNHPFAREQAHVVVSGCSERRGRDHQPRLLDRPTRNPDRLALQLHEGCDRDAHESMGG